MKNQCMKKYPILLTIRDMRIKSIRHHFTPTRMAKIKKIINAVKNLEKLEL